MTTEEIVQFREIVRTEVKNEITSALNPVNKKLNRAVKDISYMVKTFDKDIVNHRQRIETIEERLDIPHPHQN